MDKISKSEKTVTEYALRFIFALGAHCDDKTIVSPIIRKMVESNPDRKDQLDNALSQLKVGLMMVGDQPEYLIESLTEDKESRDGMLMIAEKFVTAANGKVPVAVLKMAMPEEAKNHRVRQLFRRRKCDALAGLCSVIKPGELVISA